MVLLRNSINSFSKIIRRYSKLSDNYVEVRIPVPWGYIAGKWWGSQDKKPILVLHGYQDNCGSFDRLLPELSSDNSFLAVDVPGQGLSSHIPKGMFYNFFIGPLLIRQIRDYFNWNTVSLMGHSMGGMMCFGYTTYLPQTVDFLITLDGLLPIVLPKYSQRNGELLDKYLKYSKLNDLNQEPPSYTFEELEKKLHEGTKSSIALENSKYILNRCVSPSKVNPGKYYFTMDQRLKAGPHFIGAPNLFREEIDSITCPVFILIPERSPFFKPTYKSFFEEHLDHLGKKEHVEIHFLPGSHHIHLNEPEKIHGILKKFLLKYDTIDRSVGGVRQEILSSVG